MTAIKIRTCLGEGDCRVQSGGTCLEVGRTGQRAAPVASAQKQLTERTVHYLQPQDRIHSNDSNSLICILLTIKVFATPSHKIALL